MVTIPIQSLIQISRDRQIELEKNRQMLPVMGYQVWIRELRTTVLNFGRQAGHTRGALDYLMLHDSAVLVEPSFALTAFAKQASHPEVQAKVWTIGQFLEKNPYGETYPYINTVIVDEAGMRKFRTSEDRAAFIDAFYEQCEYLGVQHVIFIGSTW